MRSVLDEHGSLVDKAGNALAMLVSKNPELRNALMTMKPDEEPKVKDGIDTTMSFAETKERSIKPAELGDSWKQYLANRHLDFAKMSSGAQDSVRDQFTKRYVAEKTTDTKGFWAKVVAVLMGEKIKKDPTLRAQLN